MSERRFNYDVDQVRERTDVLSLVGQYVALKKRGTRYTGLCPFHQEKTPSFTVDPQKGMWHCFGCGKGGDAFSFLMNLERLTFPEALERLAERAGIQPTVSFEPVKRKEEKDFLYEVNSAAAAAFSKAFLGQAGARARAYLDGRGISLADAERFGLGYAPADWDALTKHLSGRGFSVENMVKAGLSLVRTSGEGHIDRFRNRLMIPIYDRRGRVVAFGGRALSKEDNPKYLNTAETAVFHKGSTLYALNLASDSMTKRNRALVTEGYFDAIACHLAGFTETVATLGTALSEEHVQMLRRLAERVYLVFDADSAGVNAALRSQAMFREAGADVRIVRLPAGHDPDTLLREGGAAAMERCLTEALSPVEFELQQLITRYPERDVESRVRLFRESAKILQPLSRIEREEYSRWLIERWASGTLRGDETQLQQALLAEVGGQQRRDRRQAPASAASGGSGVVISLEREVMALIVQHTELAEAAIAGLPVEAFTNPAYRELYIALANMSAGGTVPDARRLVTEEERIASLVASLALAETCEAYGEAPANVLARFCEEYETKRIMPQEFDLEGDQESIRLFMAKQIERSRRAAQKGSLDM